MARVGREVRSAIRFAGRRADRGIEVEGLSYLRKNFRQIEISRSIWGLSGGTGSTILIRMTVFQYVGMAIGFRLGSIPVSISRLRRIPNYAASDRQFGMIFHLWAVPGAGEKLEGWGDRGGGSQTPS